MISMYAWNCFLLTESCTVWYGIGDIGPSINHSDCIIEYFSVVSRRNPSKHDATRRFATDMKRQSNAFQLEIFAMPMSLSWRRTGHSIQLIWMSHYRPEICKEGVNVCSRCQWKPNEWRLGLGVSAVTSPVDRAHRSPTNPSTRSADHVPAGWIHPTISTGWVSATHLEVSTLQRLPAWISGSRGGAPRLSHPPLRLDDADHPLSIQSGNIRIGGAGPSAASLGEQPRCDYEYLHMAVLDYAFSLLVAAVLEARASCRVLERLEAIGDVIPSPVPSKWDAEAGGCRQIFLSRLVPHGAISLRLLEPVEPGCLLLLEQRPHPPGHIRRPFPCRRPGRVALLRHRAHLAQRNHTGLYILPRRNLNRQFDAGTGRLLRIDPPSQWESLPLPLEALRIHPAAG